MAVSTIEIPNEFNFARQTIPFLVKSSLIGPGGTGVIDPIERAFRFVFDVTVQTSTGVYKTYASIAIPPRPDNYFSFFDVSPLIIDSLSYDLGTHQVTGATACANSIAKFKVFCTERYLDANGNFISGNKTSLGEYYAIDGAGNEGISPYLIDSLTLKKPLHYHQLIGGDEFVVSQKEPLTLSWLSRNDLGVNELEYIHGDFGTFNNSPTVGTASTANVLNVYSGITKNALTTVVPGVGQSLGGANSLLAIMAGVTTGGNANVMVWKYTNLDFSANTSYKFSIWVKNVAGSLPASSAYTFQAVVTGTNFIAITGTSPVISSTFGTWREVSVIFATTSLFSSGDITGIEIRYNSSSLASPLGALNTRPFYYDSATLYDVEDYLGNFPDNPDVIGPYSGSSYLMTTPQFGDKQPFPGSIKLVRASDLAVMRFLVNLPSGTFESTQNPTYVSGKQI
jgi:hypothetical protein